jgi:heat shock protein HslJ
MNALLRLGLMAASILLSACAARTAAAPRETSGAALAGQTWSLAALDGAKVTVPDERSRPTLAFDAAGQRVSGHAGVNRFGGTYAPEGAKLKFGPLLATKMAGPPELNDLETRYLRALERTEGWRIDGGELELLAGERVLARFAAKK